MIFENYYLNISFIMPNMQLNAGETIFGILKFHMLGKYKGIYNLKPHWAFQNYLMGFKEWFPFLYLCKILYDV